MIGVGNFKKEVSEWAEIVGVSPKEIHMRRMSKKWASCSAKGRLTFSYNILYKGYWKRSKIIVHELLHMRYPTHNKMFESLLTSYLSKKGIKSGVIKL